MGLAPFLGAFAILARGDAFLFVQNRREIGGRIVLTWDLPGGRVEAGELLGEALRREVREEVSIEIAGTPEFAFCQEGERVVAGRRVQAWRSFFFTVDAFRGEPRAAGEVLAMCWLGRHELAGALTAPYHDSFLRWVDAPRAWYASEWREP
jgi:ADP-ribose pyrophosphatase YjhB (NUDIX family)